MNKIFKKTEGKSCSWLTGKKCSGCKKQNVLKPVVYIEEPRRLPTSIFITRFGEKRNKIHITKDNESKQINKQHTEEKKKAEKLDKTYAEEKRVQKQRKADEKLKKEQLPINPEQTLPSLRSWYRQRRALKRIERERRKEWKYREKQGDVSPHAAEETKEGEKKRRKLKEREATAKPLVYSKYAAVKHANKTNKTLTYRFVNFCNKLCCQCYCYFSIIFILGFMFIYFL